MAYSTANRPALIVGGLGGGAQSTVGASTAATGYATAMGGFNIWGYMSSDPVATVAGAGYFTDGGNLGMKLGDMVRMLDTGQGTTLVQALGVVTSVTTAPSSGYFPVTVYFGNLGSTI